MASHTEEIEQRTYNTQDQIVDLFFVYTETTETEDYGIDDHSSCLQTVVTNLEFNVIKLNKSPKEMRRSDISLEDLICCVQQCFDYDISEFITNYYENI